MREILFLDLLLAEQRLRHLHLGHDDLVVEAELFQLERGRQREDRPAVLDRDDTPGIEARSVADALHLIDDRHRGISGPHEIGVQRMDETLSLDGALRRHQRLADHLPAEDPLPSRLRAAATEDVDLDRLQIERRKQPLHRRRP